MRAGDWLPTAENDGVDDHDEATADGDDAGEGDHTDDGDDVVRIVRLSVTDADDKLLPECDAVAGKDWDADAVFVVLTETDADALPVADKDGAIDGECDGCTLPDGDGIGDDACEATDDTVALADDDDDGVDESGAVVDSPPADDEGVAGNVVGEADGEPVAVRNTRFRGDTTIAWPRKVCACREPPHAAMTAVETPLDIKWLGTS